MILVTGATGFVGRHLVKRLLEEGHRVRCLVLPELAQELPQHDHLEVVTGHMLDEEVLFRAVTQVHVIYHLANAQWWGRPRDLERVELVGARNLVAAARAARVGRVILLSHIGAAPSSAYPLLQIKGLVEEVVRDSGLAYTIIRSGVLFGEDDSFINHIALMLRANPFFFLMPGRGEVALHPLYIDDLVTALVRCLDRINLVDTVVEVGGPEYISLADLLRTTMRVSGMRRLVIPVPPYLMRWITVVYSRIFPRALMTPQWLDLLAVNRCASIGALYNHFDIHPRRLEDTLLTYMPKRNYWRALMQNAFRRRPKGL